MEFNLTILLLPNQTHQKHLCFQATEISGITTFPSDV